ncbi:HsdM family class I SAM-dependent methyltransferase [Empedobacter sp. UBA7248]|uniref:HsdM family class I SAM-dependent methyltransferase n=1 Tax=Empedobacter sp. UBA7248 TaxID=1946448 RepID=UPI0025BC12C8|nr:N-6 DNA methylase [Empedobacter sp. UBA7248]
MNQKIYKFLKEYSYAENDINNLLVSSFLKLNNINKVNNIFINQFIIDDIQLEKFISYFDEKFTIELLLELFEFVISPEDKEVNGAVFTPVNIRDFIIENVFRNFTDRNIEIYNLKFGDIACGCGGFFKTIADKLSNNFNKTYYDIYRENIFGLDIQEYSIIRTKILLSLHAILNGEDREEFIFNLFVGDALNFNWNNIPQIELNAGFDAIVGNPPYVGSVNLDKETKLKMKSWSVSSTGKLDLYIPFFQIGLELINPNGILGYITVNNFYRSLNGRALRSYLSDNGFAFKLIDFGGEQVFKSRLTYTCICLINKYRGLLNYTNSNPLHIQDIQNEDFISFNYSSLNHKDGWHLEEVRVKLNINKLENSGDKLGNIYNIKNGFATLRNKIYLFQPTREDELYYYFTKDGQEFHIERLICRDAIKPNILKTEDEIEVISEKIIFPYEYYFENNSGLFNDQLIRSVRIIDEEFFENNFPRAYDYLSNCRIELSKRDKGNRLYEKWYAYGRSQAINIQGLKLLFPYMSDAPYFVFTNNEDLLFYNGYAIVSNNEEDLLFIQKILKSDIFWYYIKKTSKPYASNYFALAKNYIKNFSIPHFTNIEKRQFMRLTSKNSINRFLMNKYNITDIEF